MKKSSDLSRLLGYAGGRRVLTYLSWVLSAVSALVALVPFWYIWRILKEVLETAPDFAAAIHIVPWGWRAVGFAVLSVLLYIAGLMCSHLAAFRIATNLRLALTEHIARLPLGQIQVSGSGKLRRTIADTAGAAETFLAHQLPDQYRAMATVAGLLVLLLAFDWRLGLLSLLPVALGFACMSTMTGKSMQEKMTEYQNALADMSNQAVEYVRGIPVVKTFGQTVFSFKKFKDTIDNYQRWTIAYTKQLRGPMTAYTLAVNSVFVFLIVPHSVSLQDSAAIPAVSYALPELRRLQMPYFPPLHFSDVMKYLFRSGIHAVQHLHMRSSLPHPCMLRSLSLSLAAGSLYPENESQDLCTWLLYLRKCILFPLLQASQSCFFRHLPVRLSPHYIPWYLSSVFIFYFIHLRFLVRFPPHTL